MKESVMNDHEEFQAALTTAIELGLRNSQRGTRLGRFFFGAACIAVGGLLVAGGSAFFGFSKQSVERSIAEIARTEARAQALEMKNDMQPQLSDAVRREVEVKFGAMAAQQQDLARRNEQTAQALVTLNDTAKRTNAYYSSSCAKSAQAADTSRIAAEGVVEEAMRHNETAQKYNERTATMLDDASKKLEKATKIIESAGTPVKVKPPVGSYVFNH
jgi:hypothetical protein